MNFVLLKGSNSCLYTLKFPSHACFHDVSSQISNQCYSHYARIRSNQHKPTIYKPTPRSNKGRVNDRSIHVNVKGRDKLSLDALMF